MKTYFITGATGAVGSALVPLLLEDPQVEVKLLIRAPSSAELPARLESLFQFWDVSAKDDALRRRVIALRGDATKPHFGVAETEYEELVESCTHIVHAAGNVRMNLPIEAARRSAVHSARHIVTLARACLARGILKKVEFVSTVGVGGRMPVVEERWLTEPREFHNTYEQAKAEAEAYLQVQIEQHGLPVTVHRPSMVVGDSLSGKIIHYQIFYYLCEFLSGRQTLGLMPNLRHTRLDTIPVDYVANALRWSSNQQECAGKVYHLCSGPDQALELNWLMKALQEILRAHGEKLPHLHLVPLWIFHGTLPLLKSLAGKNTRKALNNLSLFLDYAGDRQQFANGASKQMLASAGIGHPAPSDYLGNVVTAYLESKYR